MPTRLAWITDIHLDCAGAPALSRFFASLWASAPDAVVLSGDIAEAASLTRHLAELQQQTPAPLYFVLGNHDFYGGSLRRVREQVTQFTRQQPSLNYLTTSPLVELTPQTALFGHDGWADARLGNYERSYVMMHDYRLIEELAQVGKRERWPLLKSLGDEAAAEVQPRLIEALGRYPRAIFVTHVPPFAQSCWYDGRPSDEEWLPHFSCQAMGQMLLEVMRAHPHRQLTVLCGHTHGRAEFRPLENLTVWTGGAQYGDPQVERVFDVV